MNNRLIYQWNNPWDSERKNQWTNGIVNRIINKLTSGTISELISGVIHINLWDQWDDQCFFCRIIHGIYHRTRRISGIKGMITGNLQPQ
jgi:hypothetical protein